MNDRKLIVLLYGFQIGSIIFDGRRYIFDYEKASPHPLSLSLPLGKVAWHEQTHFVGRHFSSLPHYFENLLPEGWLLDVAKAMRRDPRDKLEMLYDLCRDTLGAVSFAWPLEEGGTSTLAAALSAQSNEADFSSKVDAEKSSFLLFCLRCAKRLPHRGYNSGFHETCSQSFFGTPRPPKINVHRQNLRQVAEEHLKRGESITGSQEKFSLKYKIRDRTIIIPGFSYIVKPRQREEGIQDLPRTEHVLMSFAAHLGLGVAETALVMLADGTDAFITKRFDRTSDGGRIHVEDMSQASGELRGSEGTYFGSMELLAKQLSDPLIEVSTQKESRRRLLNSAIFNFLFGNTDGHLKNHSIIWHQNTSGDYRFSLAPFYDLVPCALYANDDNELGLKIGGKNSGFDRATFEKFAEERLSLRHIEVSQFINLVKKERSFLIGLLESYELASSQITKLMALAGERIQRLDDRSQFTKQASKRTQKLVVAEKIPSAPEYFLQEIGPSSGVRTTAVGVVIDEAFCQSSICKNPNGRTRLKGSRRKFGICSFCQPES